MKVAFILLAISLTFVSCSSLQENIVSIEQTSEVDEILSIETQLASIDAAFLLGGDTKEATVLIKNIEEILKKKTLEAASEARLYALKGRLHAILGDNGKASQCLEKSQSAYKGDVQSYILSVRLGVNTADFTPASAEEENIMALEEAIKNYIARLYLEAAAAFDSAFLNLPAFYGEAYKSVRDNAWALRSLDENTSETEMKLLLKEKLSVSELILLSELSANLTSKYSLEKKLSEKDLFRLITSKGLLSPASSSAEFKQLDSDDIATRIVLARYLWNLYCELQAKDGLKTQYSQLYRSQNEPSPVPDVSVESDDFDAVLGTVENELLSLPDGENFEPNEAVPPIEAANSFKKLRK